MATEKHAHDICQRTLPSSKSCFQHPVIPVSFVLMFAHHCDEAFHKAHTHTHTPTHKHTHTHIAKQFVWEIYFQYLNIWKWITNKLLTMYSMLSTQSINIKSVHYQWQCIIHLSVCHKHNILSMGWTRLKFESWTERWKITQNGHLHDFCHFLKNKSESWNTAVA